MDDFDWIWKQPDFIGGKDDLNRHNSCVITCTHRNDYGDGKIFICAMCPEAGEISYKRLDGHLQGDEHRMKAKKLCRERDEQLHRYGESRNLHRIVRKLGSPHRLESIILRYISGDDGTTYEEVTSVIREYEKREPFVLLELAFWKAACLTNPPKAPNSDIFTHYRTWVNGGGWKKDKAIRRRANEFLVDAVISNIASFVNG